MFGHPLIMNTTSLLRLLPLLLLPLGAHAAPKIEVLIDLTEIRHDHINQTTEKNWEYAFMEWDKKVTNLPGKGALVQAPSGRGGLGENKTMVRFGKTKEIVITLVVGNANKAQRVRFGLEDRDGTKQNWNIPIGELSKGTPHNILINLEKCSDEEEPGKKPGLNREKIHAWQLKGDWQDANVEVLFVKILSVTP